jgi:hypothetical protein
LDDPRKHLDARDQLDDQPITTEEEVALIVESTTLEMLLSEVPKIWRSGRQTIGVITDKLAGTPRSMAARAIGTTC